MQTEQRAISIAAAWLVTGAGFQGSVMMERAVDALFPTKATSPFISLFRSQVWHDTKAGLEPHICFPPQLFKWLHQLAAFSDRCSVINGLFMSLWSHYRGISQTTIFKRSCWIVVKKGSFYLFYVFLYDYG